MSHHCTLIKFSVFRKTLWRNIFLVLKSGLELVRQLPLQNIREHYRTMFFQHDQVALGSKKNLTYLPYKLFSIQRVMVSINADEQKS